MDYIFCAEQIEVPKELPAIMKNYSKEVIRYNPPDLYAFSRQYFAALAKGPEDVEDFLADLEAQAKPKTRRAPTAAAIKASEISVSKSPKAAGSKLATKPAPAAPSSGAANLGLPDGEGEVYTSPGGTVRRLAAGDMAIQGGGGKRGKIHINQKGIELNRKISADGSITPDQTVRKREVFAKAFNKFDTDRSGTIDVQELSELLGDLQWDNGEEAVAKATQALDKDNNGTIDLDEFLNWTAYAWKHQAHARHARQDSLSVRAHAGYSRKSSLSVGPATEQSAARQGRRPSLLDVVGEDAEEPEEGVEEDAVH